jgi:hypothetical protein
MLRLRRFLLLLFLIYFNSSVILADITPFVISVDHTATGGGKWYSIGNILDASDLNLLSGPVGLGIEDASLTACLMNTYDGAHGIAVDGLPFANPDNDVKLVSNALGTTITSDTGTLSGLDINLQYFFHAKSPAVRILATFTNSTGSGIDATVRYGGNVGSDEQTTIVATSSGDTTLDASDRWSISDDDKPDDGSPVNTFVYYGPGSPSVTPTNIDSDKDKFYADYNLNVAAGTSQSLMWFGAISESGDDALAFVGKFDSNISLMASGLLDGLESSELYSVLNWDIDPPSPPVPVPGALVLGSIGFGLITMIHRRIAI